MNNTTIKSLCLALLLGGMATGCVPEEDPVIKVESVTIATGDLTLTEGEDVTLSAEVLPKDATDKTVKWSSSDERIVMVSSSGKMAAISVGKAVVTAKADEKSDFITVTVVAKTIPVTGISLDKPSITVTVDESEQLTATVTPADATNKNVIWSSSDTKVATVEDGKVAGVAPGTATVTARTEDDGKTAECAVTVEAKVPPSVTVGSDHVSAVSAVLYGKANIKSTTSSDLEVGFQYSTSQGILPSNSVKVKAADADADYNYLSGITGLEPGKTYYYRSYISQKGQDTYGETMSFTTKALSSMLATRSATEVEPKSALLNAMLDLTDVQYASMEYGFCWGTSSGSQNNIVSCGSIVKNAYSAPLPSLSAKTQYWFKSYVKLDNRTFYGDVVSFTTGIVNVQSVTLDKTDYFFDTIGKTITLKATVLPEDAENREITWSSSDTRVATVSSSGVVKAVSNGDAVITVRTKDQNLTATCEIRVEQQVTDVRLDQTSLSLLEGEEGTITATVTPGNAYDPSLTWSTSDPSVADVDGKGHVVAVSKGTATITACANDGSGHEASCSVRVIRPVAYIKVSYPAILYTGNTVTITADVYPSTADNTGVSWSSSDPSVATVSANGEVTALSSGNVTIKATAQDGYGAWANCGIEIRQYVTDLSLSESSLNLTEGALVFLPVTLSPDNASDKTLNWTSSNESVAKVNSKGGILAVAPGTATVTVSTMDGSGLSASCSVSVNPQPVPEMVDLGLSVRWASFNVGASAPEEFGGYYAWGETESKLDYTWVTYKFRTSGEANYNIQLSKYNSNSYCGYVDYKTKLDAQDDVARVKLGGKWRMPTREEFYELCSSSNCTWEVTTINGVYGSKVTSKKEGYTDKWIFIPAAGRIKGTDFEGRRCGFYLSSTRDSDSQRAYSLGIIDDWQVGNGLERYNGLSVRAVTDEVNPVTSVTLNKTTLNLVVGKSETLTATVAPANATNKTVKWTSSNTSVATVSSSGLVTAMSAGTATITASARDGYGAYDQCTVTVTPPEPEAVDLGMSVKWATYNVGATAPEQYGNYYAWGETTTKSSYDWGNYTFRTGGSTYSDLKFSKYNSLSGYGTVDNKKVLDLTDDAARTTWGGTWRMPTREEFDELSDNCTWEYTSINGVYGQKLTSKMPGYTDKWIFLPAAGRKDGSNSVNVGSRGYYWTSSHSVGWADKAYEQFFNSSDKYITVLEHYFGITVRPVRP